MELKDIVCSKESGERLRELKVKQNSFFYWKWRGTFLEWCIYDPKEVGKILKGSYSAFTCAELGRMLPMNLTTSGRKSENIYTCIYGTPDGMRYFESETEAEARAKMLIYLLEQKIIKVEDINNE